MCNSDDFTVKRFWGKYSTGICFLGIILASSSTLGQGLPGSADVGRIEGGREVPLESRLPVSSPLFSSGEVGKLAPPIGAGSLRMVLRDVLVEGSSVFSSGELSPYYAEMLETEITADRIWEVANAITRHYQDAGYFLSRAVVPSQQLDGSGVVRIRVIEGSIEAVHVGKGAGAQELETHWLLQDAKAELLAQRPVQSHALESLLLRLNDMPGVRMRTVLEPIEGGGPGTIALRLIPEERGSYSELSFDNHGSKFLGPYQAGFRYVDDFLMFQETDLFVLASLPTEELRFGSITHRLSLSLDWQLHLSADTIASEPGHALAVSEIKSDSLGLELGFAYQAIRQRQENLSLGFGFTSKNTNTDVRGFALTRDKVRYVYGKLEYDTADDWYGYNYLSVTIKQGLDMLGASDEGSTLLSRAEADPDFSILNLSYTRQQWLDEDVLAIVSARGQVASGPLHSSQEIGYGGQSYGRAYDASEILGDHGVMASAELRYLGLDTYDAMRLEPYAFIDTGAVWNEDAAQQAEQTASSAGIGMRLSHEEGASLDIGLAFPIGKDIDDPLYGNGDTPRFYGGLRLRF